MAYKALTFFDSGNTLSVSELLESDEVRIVYNDDENMIFSIFGLKHDDICELINWLEKSKKQLEEDGK